MAEATERRRYGAPRVAAAGAMVAGAACLVATGLIHLHLYHHGYGGVPTIGPLFLMQAVVSFVLAAVVALWHRWFVAAGGALFLVATMGGLFASTWFGLFGFHDSLSAPYAGLSLTVEAVGAVVLGFAAVVLFFSTRRHRAGTGLHPAVPAPAGPGGR
jgi:hypothetical protein